MPIDKNDNVAREFLVNGQKVLHMDKAWKLSLELPIPVKVTFNTLVRV